MIQFSRRKLREYLSVVQEDFTANAQLDVSEVLTFIFENIKIDFDILSSHRMNAVTYDHDYLNLQDQNFPCLLEFYYQLKTLEISTCLACGTEKYTDSVNYYFFINLPAKGKEEMFNLDNLIELSFEAENRGLECCNCQSTVQHSRKSFIRDPPKILIFLINRFLKNESGSFKNLNPVTLPSQLTIDSLK